MKGTLTYTIEGLETDFGLLRVTVEAEYTASAFDPGCSSGPPESCYPPEGGDVEEITFSIEKVWELGCEWNAEYTAEKREPLLAAVEKWYEDGPGNEILGDLIGQRVAEARYDDEPDYYDPRDYNLGPDAPGQGNW